MTEWRDRKTEDSKGRGRCRGERRQGETRGERDREAQRGEIDKGDRDRGRDRSREQAPKNSKESTGFRKERDHIQTQSGKGQ